MPNNDFFSDAPTNANQNSDLRGKTITLPIVEEFMSVEKNMVEVGTITVNKQVEEKDESVDVNLLSDEYSIEHIPVNQYADDLMPPV